MDMEVFYTEHAWGLRMNEEIRNLAGLISKYSWMEWWIYEETIPAICFRCWIWLVWRSQSFNKVHLYVECALIKYYLKQTWRQIGVMVNLGIPLFPFSVSLAIGSGSILTAVSSVNNIPTSLIIIITLIGCWDTVTC